jgi:hypothetical protein
MPRRRVTPFLEQGRRLSSVLAIGFLVCRRDSGDKSFNIIHDIPPLVSPDWTSFVWRDLTGKSNSRPMRTLMKSIRSGNRNLLMPPVMQYEAACAEGLQRAAAMIKARRLRLHRTLQLKHMALEL